MLVSFTQTYGNGRRELLEIYSRDQKLIEFKSYFDINFYSFHNSSKETIDHFNSINQVKNTEILEFKGKSYGNCIQSLIEKLENLKCTHFFFSQDDTFSLNNEDLNFATFFDYVKKQKDNFMICLGHSYINLYDELKDLKTMNLFGERFLYENNSLNYGRIIRNRGGLDDEAYIASFDLVKKIYNKDYFNSGNVWGCEKSLTRRFEKENIPRDIFDKALFQNYNIMGRNSWNKDQLRKDLKNKKLL